MKTLKFKTNINCGGCVKAVSGFLNNEDGIASWNVDTNNPDKVLTVQTEVLDSEQVAEIVKNAGFMTKVMS